MHRIILLLLNKPQGGGGALKLSLFVMACKNEENHTLCRILASSCPSPDLVQVYLICKHAALTSAAEQAATPERLEVASTREGKYHFTLSLLPESLEAPLLVL